jgi:hypothetical protein
MIASEWTLAGMFTLMYDEVAAFSTPVLTFVTGKSNLTGMRTLVHNESTASSTSIIAFVACEWTLAGVNAHVFHEIVACCTAIIAFVACEWTLAGVSALVFQKIAAICTSKIACVACEWTLTGMNALVRVETCFGRKLTLAFVAGEQTRAWQLPALRVGCCATTGSGSDGFLDENFISLVRSWDKYWEPNEISAPLHAIVRDFSLGRLANVARRKCRLMSRADRSASLLHSRGSLDDLAVGASGRK